MTIEREIAPNEKGILFFLMVTEDFTIEQLQLMVSDIPFDHLMIMYSNCRLRQDFQSVMSNNIGLLGTNLPPIRSLGLKTLV